MASPERLKSFEESLRALQTFDVESLGREADFGNAGNFSAAIEPAWKIVDYFRKFHLENLDCLSDGQIHTIDNIILNIRDNIFGSLLRATTSELNNKTNLIASVHSCYNNVIDSLHPILAYYIASNLDYEKVNSEIDKMIDEAKSSLAPMELQIEALNKLYSQTEARASSIESEIQARKGSLDDIVSKYNLYLESITKLSEESKSTLITAQAAASAAGISSQSVHFGKQSEIHKDQARNWLWASICLGIADLGLAGFSAFSYTIKAIAPTNNIEVAQFISGKIIFIGLVSYLLVTSVRNYASQMHNSVVNKHRQNSLMTYQAFLGAAPSLASREIILTHAAASVFSPQDTGYVKNEEPNGGKSVVEMLMKSAVGEPRGS